MANVVLNVGMIHVRTQLQEKQQSLLSLWEQKDLGNIQAVFVENKWGITTAIFWGDSIVSIVDNGEILILVRPVFISHESLKAGERKSLTKLVKGRWKTQFLLVTIHHNESRAGCRTPGSVCSAARAALYSSWWPRWKNWDQIFRSCLVGQDKN